MVVMSTSAGVIMDFRLFLRTVHVDKFSVKKLFTGVKFLSFLMSYSRGVASNLLGGGQKVGLGTEIPSRIQGVSPSGGLGVSPQKLDKNKLQYLWPVSYTHLTLPTKRIV